MKKTLFALALFAAAAATQAADVTASVGHNFGPDATVGSLALGKQFGTLRGEVVAGRVTAGGFKANALGVNATYPLATLSNVTLAAKGGVSYLAVVGPSTGGFAVNAGLEASMPLTKTLSLVSSLERVQAQNRIGGFSGNQFAVGIRSTF